MRSQFSEEIPHDFSKPVYSVEVEVREGEGGIRIDRYLTSRFPWKSRQYFRNLVRKSEVSLNGKTPKPHSPVRPGDRVWVRIPEVPGDPRTVPLDIIYEDSEIVVLNKRAGYLVHPTGKTRLETILSALHLRYRNEDDPALDIVPRHCHRLDRGTSGVLIVAKTLSARQHIQKQFEARTVKKDYLAIVEGTPPDEGTIEIPLEGLPNRRTRMRPAEGGLPCLTRFRRLGGDKGLSLVSAHPETGRQHQIRVHLAALGTPILCDPIYGHRSMLLGGDVGVEPATEPLLSRQALHCWRMRITHPRTGEELSLVAPPAPDLKRILDVIGVELGSPD
ncbi:MAG: RluA family pseudouridine synthase [Planctomycetota bacterium]|nr:RluA family pseudouridine synthase [Planctomycetota bacterium]